MDIRQPGMNPIHQRHVQWQWSDFSSRLACIMASFYIYPIPIVVIQLYWLLEVRILVAIISCLIIEKNHSFNRVSFFIRGETSIGLFVHPSVTPRLKIGEML